MSKYLLEIGVEELPYKFINNACEQLKSEFEKLFETQKIEYSSLETFATPRRLVVFVKNLAEKQPDITKSIKGPPAKVAFNEDGTLSQAGLGFLKKQGIEQKDTQIIVDNGIEYIFATIEQKGQNTAEILKNEVALLILKLQGPHFMRWADLDIKFSRPVRWIVSIFDKVEIPVSIGNVTSSNKSRGHRFSKNKEVVIDNIDNYFEIMKSSNVIVKQDERKALVLQLLEEKASEVEGIIQPDDELLDEITNILEWPVPVMCSFSEDYLKIPDDVTVTVMKAHQRYFPVYSKSGKLTNYFITMANFVGDEFENIRVGNERVIKARLEDGKFFYEEDLKKKLVDRVEDLKGITFQKGLGTMYDKCQRLVGLSGLLAEELGEFGAKQSIQRTALLCKADLLTNLVYEFTELEGFIGADYALKTGESESVANGIKEHYFPLGADSAVAKGIEGQVTGIVDKIDTIVTTFAVGKKPTGSADPLGIRRATLGVISTILQNNMKVNVSNVIKNAIEAAPIEISDKKALLEDIEDFFIGRLKIMFQQNYKYDHIDAVCAIGNPLSGICDVKCRLDVLKTLSQNEGFTGFNDAINRIIRITKDAATSSPVAHNLFVIEAEKALYNEVVKISVDESYNDLTEKLMALVPFISKFFEDVLVMDKDESVKNNRIGLLCEIKSKFAVLADFSKIVL